MKFSVKLLGFDRLKGFLLPTLKATLNCYFFMVDTSYLLVLKVRIDDSCFLIGKDPLASLYRWKDINAVAGVLRAYFRELKEPLFPSKFCDDYIRISRKYKTCSFSDF